MNAEIKLPLEGIKVIELGTHIAVPAATRALADWGADVIKVEAIDGDPWRNIGTQNYLCPITNEENPIFMISNANKRYVSINLKSDDGINFLIKLIKNADVFISNVRTKSLLNMGLDYESVSKLNPRLVYAHLTGYGEKGPLSKRPGFDLTSFWAKCGALVDWNDIGAYPIKPSGGFGDATTSSMINNGILAALIGRERTGKGTKVTTSLYSTSIWYNGINIVTTQKKYGNVFPKSKMNPHNPFSNVYQCKDGEWLIVTVITYNASYDKMCKILDLDNLIGNKDYNSISDLKKDEDKMYKFIEILNSAFLQKTQDEWFNIFDANDLSCEKLYHHKDVSEDEQAWANEYLTNLTFESGTTAVMPNVPIKFSEYKTDKYDSYSRIGQHTNDILIDLGYSEEEINKMVASKAVRI